MRIVRAFLCCRSRAPGEFSALHTLMMLVLQISTSDQCDELNLRICDQQAAAKRDVQQSLIDFAGDIQKLQVLGVSV